MRLFISISVTKYKPIKMPIMLIFTLFYLGNNTIFLDAEVENVFENLSLKPQIDQLKVFIIEVVS